MNRQIVQGIDIIDFVGYVSRTSKKFLATLLSQLENILSKEDYSKVRKLVLDSFNSYTRSIVSALFGNLEN
jgi:hypothetical protein